MALLERIFPSLLRRNFRQACNGLYGQAQQYAIREGLDSQHFALWKRLTELGFGYLINVFLSPTEPTLDWQLRRHLGRVEMKELLTFSWWFNLYSLNVFRQSGLAGLNTEITMGIFSDLSARWIRETSESLGVPVPEPYSQHWNSIDNMQSAKELYAAVFSQMRLEIKWADQVVKAGYFSTDFARWYELIKRQLEQEFSE